MHAHNKTNKLDIILSPHRSLNMKGFIIVMSVIAGLNLLVGLYFVSLGAWPVLAFGMLEIMIIWLAFRSNFKAANVRERIYLDGPDLIIEDYDQTGTMTNSWRFNPYWTYAEHKEEDENKGAIYLSSKGQTISVASFLPREERIEMLDYLQRKLRAA